MDEIPWWALASVSFAAGCLLGWTIRRVRGSTESGGVGGPKSERATP